MNKRLLVLLGVPLLVPRFTSGAGEEKGDLALVQGTWVIVSVEVEGKPLPQGQLDELKQIEWVVTKGRVAARKKGEKKEVTLTFKIDPKTKPKSVDLTVHDPAGKDSLTLKGIYSLDGDKLTLCGPVVPEGERPTDFTAKAKSGRMLGVFKRKGK